jgi:hypothetical protein
MLVLEPLKVFFKPCFVEKFVIEENFLLQGFGILCLEIGEVRCHGALAALKMIVAHF